MSTKNGPVVVDRLEQIYRSLDRAQGGVNRELIHRSTDEDYKDVYVRELAEIAAQASSLEDLIKRKLSFA